MMIIRMSKTIFNNNNHKSQHSKKYIEASILAKLLNPWKLKKLVLNKNNKGQISYNNQNLKKLLLFNNQIKIIKIKNQVVKLSDIPYNINIIIIVLKNL